MDPGGAVEGLKEKKQEAGRVAGRPTLDQRRGLASEGREGMQRRVKGGGTRGCRGDQWLPQSRRGMGHSPRSH